MRRAVLFDVDGTLVDSLASLRLVWERWARAHELDPEAVWECAYRTMPLETFAEVAPHLDQDACLRVLHELEDEDARHGPCVAFQGARDLLADLPADSWAVVTGNYAHRVKLRFAKAGLQLPRLLIDAAAVQRGKPDPEGYLLAARGLSREPSECLVLEDTCAGAQAGLAAGMTVWTVQSKTRPAGVDCSYGSLAEAVGDIRAWVGT